MYEPPIRSRSAAVEVPAAQASLLEPLELEALELARSGRFSRRAVTAIRN